MCVCVVIAFHSSDFPPVVFPTNEPRKERNKEGKLVVITIYKFISIFFMPFSHAPYDSPWNHLMEEKEREKEPNDKSDALCEPESYIYRKFRAIL